MKNVYQLAMDLEYKIDSWYGMELTSAQINERIKDFINKECFTASGNKRIAKKHVEALNISSIAVRKKQDRDLIIFGYWYEGDFYTTDKNNGNHKTTKELHLILNAQAFNRLQNGLYYRDSLKPYFVD